MRDNIDLNAGEIITSGVGLPEMGRTLFDKIADVCSGELTKAESLGHKEFGIYRVGYTY